MVFFLLSLYQFALARAGGGGGGGGGGFHSSYHYYNHSNGSGGSPPASVWIMIGLIALLSVFHLNRHRFRSRSCEKKWKALSETDPFWNRDQLEEMCKNIFSQIQICWMRRDLSSMEQIIVPRLFHEYQGMLDDLKNRRRIDVLGNIEFTQLRPLQIDENLLRLAILIEGKMSDQEMEETAARSTDISTLPQTGFRDIYQFRYNKDRWMLVNIVNEPGVDALNKIKW